MGIKPMQVSQQAESQTAEDMRAKWLDINNGLQDKDTCMIRRAAVEHTQTQTHTQVFYKNGKLSILECNKEKAGSYVIFYVN
jgi:hypothetical protein